MKTKEQVIRQLRLLKFTEEEWGRVHEFCQNLYSDNMCRSLKGKYDCNFEQFKDWYDNGFGAGDVVRCHKTLSMVCYQFQDIICYSSYLDMDDGLVNCEADPYFPSVDNAVLASKTETIAFYDIVNKAGYVFKPALGYLYEKDIVKVGQMYRFVVDNNSYYGIVSFRNETEIVFCFMYSEGVFVLKDFSVSIHDVHEVIDLQESKRIEAIISRDHFLYWDQPQKKMMYLPTRVDHGKMFYSITDKFTITASSDTGTKAIDAKYFSGNYFSSREDAFLFLSKLKDLRTQLLMDRVIK